MEIRITLLNYILILAILKPTEVNSLITCPLRVSIKHNTSEFSILKVVRVPKKVIRITIMNNVFQLGNLRVTK